MVLTRVVGIKIARVFGVLGAFRWRCLTLGFRPSALSAAATRGGVSAAAAATAIGTFGMARSAHGRFELLARYHHTFTSRGWRRRCRLRASPLPYSNSSSLCGGGEGHCGATRCTAAVVTSLPLISKMVITGPDRVDLGGMAGCIWGAWQDVVSSCAAVQVLIGHTARVIFSEALLEGTLSGSCMSLCAQRGVFYRK